MTFPLPMLDGPLNATLFFITMNFSLYFNTQITTMKIRLKTKGTPSALGLFQHSSYQYPQTRAIRTIKISIRPTIKGVVQPDKIRLTRNI